MDEAKKQKELVALRDSINSNDGKRILDECQRYMVETGSRQNSNAEWIKGMALLINRLKSIDDECQRLYNKQ